MNLTMHDDAIVVFEDRVERAWLRLLPRGFRHCFCVLRTGSRWLVVDPLLGGLHTATLDLPQDFPLARVLQSAAAGRHVLSGPLGDRRPGRRGGRATTCVAAVKRLIRLEASHVLTPRALHRELRRRGWRRPR